MKLNANFATLFKAVNYRLGFLLLVLFFSLFYFNNQAKATNTCGLVPGSNPPVFQSGTCDDDVGKCQASSLTSAFSCGSATNCYDQNGTSASGPVCLHICDCNPLWNLGQTITSASCSGNSSGGYYCQDYTIGGGSCQVDMGKRTNYVVTQTPGACIGSGGGNAACGFANGQYYANSSFGNLCQGQYGGVDLVSGNFTSTATGWSWTCTEDKFGGYAWNCGAMLLTCGSAANVSTNSAPTSSLCGPGGSASTVSLSSGSWKWTCDNSVSGASVSCSAPVLPSATCGTASKTYNFDANFGTDTFCSSGSSSPAHPTFPSSGGTVNWTCGSNNCFATVPPKPSINDFGSCAGSTATFSWNPVSGYSSYYVRMHDDTNNTDINWIDNYSGTSFTANNLTPGHSYHWWVHTRAGNGAYGPPAMSSASNTFNCTPADFTISATPDKTTMSGGDSAIIKVSILPVNGFKSDVIIVPPSGFNIFPTTATVLGGSGDAYFTYTSNPTDSGPKALTFTGSSGSLSHNSTANISITALPPEVTLSSNPGSVKLGDSSTLFWNVKYASSCSSKGTDALPILNITGTNWQTPNSSGSILGSAPTPSLSSVKTYSYTLECSNAGGVKSATATVAVNKPADVVLSLAADSTIINYNTQTTLRWSVANAKTCTSSSMPTSSLWQSGTSGSVLTGFLTAPKTYTLTCSGDGNPATASVTVNVNPPPDVSVKLTADSLSVNYNSGTNIYWTVANATACTSTSMPVGNWSTGGSGSAVTGNLQATKTYRLDCTGLGNPGYDQITITVGSMPGVCGSTINGKTFSSVPSSSLFCDTNFGFIPNPVSENQNSWSWNCLGSSNGGSQSGQCMSYKTASCGSAQGGYYYFSAPPTSPNLCNVGNSTGASINGNFWQWTCLSGSSSVNCQANVNADGQCNSLTNGQNLSSEPTTNLCSSAYGNSAVVLNNNLWTWDCNALNKGVKVTCFANQKTTGVCASLYNNKSFTSGSLSSASSLCDKGTIGSSFSGSGPWTWNCSGINNGSTDNCSASLADCGSASGGSYGSLTSSSANLCNSNAVLVSNSFNSTASGWSWQCNGSGPTSNPKSCSASQSACVSGSVQINPPKPFYINDTTTLSVPSSWSGSGSFVSSNPSIASISGNKVKGESGGTANITATGFTDPSNHTNCSLSGTAINVADFSLAGAISPQTIQAGKSTIITIDISGINGFAHNVDVTNLSLPAAGMSLSPTSASLNPTGVNFASYNLSTQSITPTGSYKITFSGFDKLSNTTRTTSVIVNITAPDCSIDSFIANPPGPLNYNDGSQLSWQVSNANSCSASGSWSGNVNNVSGSYNTGSLTSTKTYTLTCQGAAGTNSCVKSTAIIVNPAQATCGDATKFTFPVAPTTNLCGVGSSSYPTPVNEDLVNNLYTWICTSPSGSVNCQAGMDVNGVCNSKYANLSYTDKTLLNTLPLCSKGNLNLKSGFWSWDCSGINNGSTDYCSATLADCGTANNNNFGSLNASSANLCNSNASLVSNSFTSTASGWSWQCNGSGPTSNPKSCSASQSACVNGSVILADPWIYANKSTTASLPAGWTGGGSFVSSNPAIASVSGNKINGQTGGGSVVISGSNFTDPSNHSSCSLTGAPLDVRDFKLTGQASPAIIQAGDSSFFKINIIGIAGFDNLVNIPKVSGLPAGASLSPNQISLKPSGVSSDGFTFTTTAATPTGKYIFTFTGTDPISGLVRTVDIEIEITSPTCVINSFTSNLASPVPYNSTAILSWNSSYTSGNCSATGDWSGSKPTSGSYTTPNLTDQTKTYTYTLTCPSAAAAPACSKTINLSLNSAPPACGSASTVSSPTPPTTNLCGPGNAASAVTYDSLTNLYSWTCTSAGVSVTCQTGKQKDGLCGPLYNNKSFTSGSLSSASSLCDQGTIGSSFSGSGPWTWNCNGINSGGTDYCKADLADCGSANANNFGTLNSSSPNLCNSFATLVSGSFNSTATGWSWQCNGSGLTSTPKTCSASQSACVSGAVLINPPVPFYINDETLASLPAGWTGSGSFVSSNPAIASVTGNKIKGVLGGIANISALGFIDPSGHTNCPLGSTPISVADFSIAGSANPQKFQAGKSTIITVTITGINGFAHNVDITNLSLPAAGMSMTPISSVLNPTGVSAATYNLTTLPTTPVGVYKITFNGYDKLTNTTRKAEVLIEIIAPGCDITSFTATPPGPLNYNDSSQLSWQVSNANSCSANGDWSGIKNNVSGSYSTGNLTSSKTYNLSCQGAAGTNSCAKSVTLVINAAPPACGSATTVTSAVPPTTNLCGQGNTASAVTFDSATNLYTWTCTSAGGVSVTCQTGKDTNGQCSSSYNNKSYTSGSLQSDPKLCTQGTISSFSGSGPWSWNCNGINNGSTDNCSASLADCGSASGSSFGTLNSSSPNLCNSFATLVSGSFKSTGAGWSWQCNGSGPTSNPKSCSASQSACVNGSVILADPWIYANKSTTASLPASWTGGGSFVSSNPAIASVSGNKINGQTGGGSVVISGSNFTDPSNHSSCSLTGAPLDVRDFKLTGQASPAIIQAGDSSFFKINIIGIAGFDNLVNIPKVSGIPTGASILENQLSLKPTGLNSASFTFITTPATPTGSHTFTFFGTDPISGLVRTVDITVNITAPSCSIDSFISDPVSPVKLYDSPKISWSVSYAPNGCSASGDWSGSQPTTGSFVASKLISNKNYTLTCKGAVNTPDCSQTLEVKVNQDVEGQCGPSATTYPEGTTEPANWSSQLCAKGIANRGANPPAFPGPPTYVSSWTCCGTDGTKCSPVCTATVGGTTTGGGSCTPKEGAPCHYNQDCEKDCCPEKTPYCSGTDTNAYGAVNGKCECKEKTTGSKYPPYSPPVLYVSNTKYCSLGGFEIYWLPGTNALSYNLYRQEVPLGQNPQFSLATKIKNQIPLASQTSPLVDNSVSPGKTYQYWITSVDMFNVESTPATPNPASASTAVSALVCGKATLGGDKDIASVGKLNITNRACNGTDPLPNSFLPSVGQDIVFKLNICNTGAIAAANFTLVDTMSNIVAPTSGNYNVKYSYVDSSGTLKTISLTSTSCSSLKPGQYCVEKTVDNGITLTTVMRINLNDTKYQIGPRVSLSEPSVATISYTAQPGVSLTYKSASVMFMNKYTAKYYNGSNNDEFTRSTSYILFSGQPKAPDTQEDR